MQNSNVIKDTNLVMYVSLNNDNNQYNTKLVYYDLVTGPEPLIVSIKINGGLIDKVKLN